MLKRLHDCNMRANADGCRLACYNKFQATVLSSSSSYAMNFMVDSNVSAAAGLLLSL